jgi:hypothetical protein
MTAHTTFDREPVQVTAHSGGASAPLTERTWFRLGFVAFIATWLGACVFMVALLVH